MTKIAIGTVQFGLNYGIANNYGQVSFLEAKKIIQLAKSEGIKLLDTAISYGKSEEVLGKIGVSNFHIVTKLPALPINSNNIENWALDQVFGSLKRLKVKKIDSFLFHKPSDLLDPYGVKVLNILSQLKKEGVIDKIGLSIYNPSDLENNQKNLNKIDVVQAPISIIDRRLEKSGWLLRLKEMEIEVHARSIFLQGLLLLPRNKIPSKFDVWSTIWDNWHSELLKYHKSASKICLDYSLQLKNIDKVVVGVDSLPQLKELIKLSKDDKNKLSNFNFMGSEDLRLINPSNWNKL
jgi:aryl-alcohol dehydrogenase-like predicted oxidoreductase